MVEFYKQELDKKDKQLAELQMKNKNMIVNNNNNFNNKTITFLGVTFKANTDDMRDSSSLKMIPALSKKGAKIKYFDPTGYKKDFDK